MTSQFSPKVSEILAYSREEAARLASRSVGPEHLLLGLLRMNEGPVIDVFHRLNLNLQSIKTELENRVRENEIGKPIYTNELVLNEKASNILKLAVLEARIQRSANVNEQHLLLAILHDAVNNGAKQILELNNMNYDDVMAMLRAPYANSITNGIGLPDEDEEEFEETGSACKMMVVRGSPSFSGVKDIRAALVRADLGGALNGLLRLIECLHNLTDSQRVVVMVTDVEASLTELPEALGGSKLGRHALIGDDRYLGSKGRSHQQPQGEQQAL